HAASCSDNVDVNATVLANGFAADLANTRQFSSQIDAANVATLQLAWADVADGITERRGAPAVTQQAVFYSAGRQIVAANRQSGCRYWHYSVPAKTTPLVGSNAVRSSAIYFLPPHGEQPALVYAGDFYGNFYAIDAASGTLRWSRFIGTEKDHHTITGAPQVYDGKLIVPVSSKEVLSALFELRPCCSSHGLLQALDPYTGATLWTYDATAAARLQLRTGKLAPNGVSLWGTPAIDPARRRIYIGTGQNLTPPTTENSDAVQALDLDSGAVLWTFQATAGDAYNVSCGVPLLAALDCVRPAGPDADFGAPPMLVHLAGGGGAVIAGAKNGVVYSLNPDSGALNWSRRLGQGGSLGGIHWGMASDGTRVYAAISDVTVNKASGLDAGKLFGSNQITPVDGAQPGIYALDAASGALQWAIHPMHVDDGVATPSIYSAALTVTNDLLFAGSLDGELKAFQTHDGAERWSYDSNVAITGVDGTAGHGGTIDSVGANAAGGDLLLNSGYDSFGSSNRYQAGPGNVLYVWRLASP
ncbi:MAG TPA: PQQ-binding-like beta-propeller repeat protein, partial [Solimonas sp.]